MLKSFLDRRLDPFRPASGPPPNTLVAFTRWALAGAWPVLGIFVILSILAGGMDTLNAFLLGYIIDTAVEAGPEAFFTQHMPVVFAFVAFFLRAFKGSAPAKKQVLEQKTDLDTTVQNLLATAKQTENIQIVML